MNMSRIVKIFVVVVLTGLTCACTNSKESESEIKAVEVDLNKALPLTENVQSVDVMTLKDSETGHLRDTCPRWCSDGIQSLYWICSKTTGCMYTILTEILSTAL